jgi:hypothetical protein
MVYSTLNHWVSGFCLSARILYKYTRRNATSRKMDVSVFRWRKKDTYCVQYLKLALSKRPSRVGVSLPSHEDENKSNFQNVVFLVIHNTGWWTKFINSMNESLSRSVWPYMYFGREMNLVWFFQCKGLHISNTEIVGSNPTEAWIFVCVFLFLHSLKWDSHPT